MTDANKQSIEAVAQSVLDDAVHYAAALSAMAGSHALSAADDIVSASGTTLVARGTRIDASLRETLAQHRLSATMLEKSLAIGDGVSPESLAADIARRIDSDPWLARLAADSGDPGAMRQGAARLKLPRQLLFRLSVARDQRPALYRHTLGVAVISHYLALRSRLKPPAIDNIIIAALCHDLGELHTDPAILEKGHCITDDERRFIYVHPITGWLIVRELPAIAAEVAKAVLQHQERLDGSGYPYGRKDDTIELPGRILAAADVTESILARFGDHQRLSTLLRLNQKKYDRNIVGLLHVAIASEDAEAPTFERETLVRRLAGFASVLDGWARLRAGGAIATAIAKSAPNAFLAERMFNLRTVVLQFGFDPDSLEMPLDLAAEDAAIAAELTTVIDELQFQLTDLGREFDRRAPDVLGAVDPLAAAALVDWRRQLQECIDS